MLTYVLEVSTDGPYQFGTVHRVVAAASNILIAVLVLRLSRNVQNSRLTGILPQATATISVIGAALLLLGIPGWLDFSISSLIAVGVLAIQALWMLWVSTRLHEQRYFSPVLGRGGQIIGAGMLLGILLVGVSVFIPPLTIPHVLVLGAGVFIGGGQWLAWPLWFVILAWKLRKAKAAPAKRGRRAA